MNRVFFVLALLPTILRATVWPVYPGGSIQQAVYSAEGHDTILIHDGQYTETTVLYGKTLTIGSAFLLIGDTTHVANTVI